MSHTQTWHLQKSGSEWTEKNEAVYHLQNDLDDTGYISETVNNDQFEEIMTIDVETQTLIYERVWKDKSDCDSYVESHVDNDASLESRLSKAGWTVTEI